MVIRGRPREERRVGDGRPNPNQIVTPTGHDAKEKTDDAVPSPGLWCCV